MNKKEFIKKISKDSNLMHYQATDCYHSILQTIFEECNTTGSFSIMGFGKFYIENKELKFKGSKLLFND